MNENYLVESRQGPFLLRRYRSTRTSQEAAFEISILRHLTARQVPCQRPIPMRDGGYLAEHDRTIFCLLSFVPGHTLAGQKVTASVAEAVGQAVGAMQLALNGFCPEGSKEDADFPSLGRLVRASLAQLDRLGGLDAEVQFLHAAWRDAERYFSIPRFWARGVVHADLSPDNVVFSQGHLTGIIDFDDAYVGWMLGDIALTIMEFSFDEHQSLKLDCLNAVLRGIHAVRSLSADERSRLVPMMQFLCIKYFAYTLPLAQDCPIAVTGNAYLRRLRNLRSPELHLALSSSIQNFSST